MRKRYDDLREDLRERRLLEGQDPTDAQDEVLELEEFTGFDFIARETMKDTTREVGPVFLEDGNEFVLGLATVDHQREMEVDGPTDLFLEGQELFLFELTRPVEIQSHLADGEGSLKFEV